MYFLTEMGHNCYIFIVLSYADIRIARGFRDFLIFDSSMQESDDKNLLLHRVRRVIVTILSMKNVGFLAFSLCCQLEKSYFPPSRKSFYCLKLIIGVQRNGSTGF